MLATFTAEPEREGGTLANATRRALLVIGSGESAVTIDSRDIENCWNNASQFPERRARLELSGLAVRLNEFADFARALAESEGCAPGFDWGAEVERFTVAHVSLTRAYWARESRTASAFVVGPARFPTASNRKRMNASDKARDLIASHTLRARKACERKAFPHGRPDGPVRSDNPDALALLRERHAAARGPEKRRLADRIAEMERLPTATTERQVHGVTVRENLEAMRLQLLFPGKPDDATRQLLRARGFVWSPKAGAWQRLLNTNARTAANAVLTQLAKVQA